MLWGEKKRSETQGQELTADSVYADSSPDPFDDPKVETIVEIFKRIWVSLQPQMSLIPHSNGIRVVLGVLFLPPTLPMLLLLLSLATPVPEACTVLLLTRL